MLFLESGSILCGVHSRTSGSMQAGTRVCLSQRCDVNQLWWFLSAFSCYSWGDWLHYWSSVVLFWVIVAWRPLRGRVASELSLCPSTVCLSVDWWISEVEMTSESTSLEFTSTKNVSRWLYDMSTVWFHWSDLLSLIISTLVSVCWYH